MTLPDSKDPFVVAEWVKNTCLLLGCTPSTAYLVAGTFLKGLPEIDRQRPNDPVQAIKQDTMSS